MLCVCTTGDRQLMVRHCGDQINSQFFIIVDCGISWQCVVIWSDETDSGKHVKAGKECQCQLLLEHSSSEIVRVNVVV